GLCLLSPGAHGPGQSFRSALFLRHARPGNECRDRRSLAGIGGLFGRRSRAASAFGRARDIALRANAFGYPVGDYGSLTRDLAGVTALAADNGEADLVPALLQKSQDVDMTL